MSYTPTNWQPDDVVTAARMNSLETAVGELNMSYTPNTWVNGDVITAAKMNALEQAVAAGGGGGGGDFSTAEVVITKNAAATIPLPFCIEEGGMGGIVAYGIDDSGTYTIPLFMGMCVTTISDNVTVTGDIADNDGVIIITGDGSITTS